MADMRVRLLLDLVNRLTPGAKAAARDVKGVKDAAKGLNATRGGDRLARDFLNLSSSAKVAARGLKETKAASAALGQASGAARLSRDLDQVGRKAARARAELAQLGTVEGRRAARLQAQARAARRSAEIEPAGEAPRGFGLLAGSRGLIGGYLGIQGARLAGRSTVGQSISFEKSMAEVRKKVDGMNDPAELAKMEKMISRAAITYGRSREEVASLVAEAGAGGVSKGDMPDFIRINLAAATAWDATADKTSNAMAKIKAATGWANPQLEEFADKVNALSDAGAAKEMDVVDMFQRAGAAAKAAGVSFDSSLAFLTAMNNVAIAPEVASRGFNAFASTLRTATEQQDRVDEGLKMLGLSAKRVEKGMTKDALGTMLDVLERLEKSTDKAKAAIKIFGKEWWDEIARTGQAMPEIRKNLAIMGDPKKWRGSTANNLNIQLSTTANHLERLKALTSEVGDRLGRWSLPGINSAIEKIIAGMDEIEQRQERLQQKDSARAKVEGDRTLTPEERARIADDPALAKDVQRRGDRAADDLARNSNIRERAASDEERVRLEARRSRLDAEIARLQGQIDAIRGRSRDSGASARPIAELERKQIDARRQRGEIETALNRSRPAAIGPADRGDRESEHAELARRREQVEALKGRLAASESRLQRLESLAAAATNPANRKGFLSDRTPAIQAMASALGELRALLAPALSAAQNFNATGTRVQGKGWKDSRPANWAPREPAPPTGSGRLSFGLNGATGPGAAWAERIKSDLDIDLGPAGVTMIERLTGGLRQGGASAESAASGIRSGITGAFDGADLSAAGAAMMGSLERGITAGGDRAVAAAQRVASRVKAATAAGASGGGTGRLSGALHDGVE